MKRANEHPEGLRDQRVVKLLLPLPLIRQMDRVLLDGVGGFTTRNEFVREAIDSYMLELTHEPAHGVEVPIAGITIKEDRDARGIAHKLGDL